MWIHGDLPTHKRNKLFSNECEFMVIYQHTNAISYLVMIVNSL